MASDWASQAVKEVQVSGKSSGGLFAGIGGAVMWERQEQEDKGQAGHVGRQQNQPQSPCRSSLPECPTPLKPPESSGCTTTTPPPCMLHECCSSCPAL